ncbi:MAG: MopE-related protein, partial [Candidatus Woesearchaeota archaeon]|nr:MopE-related protein [Candidatus Woesearchaeota archaeon]
MKFDRRLFLVFFMIFLSPFVMAEHEFCKLDPCECVGNYKIIRNYDNPGECFISLEGKSTTVAAHPSCCLGRDNPVYDSVCDNSLIGCGNAGAGEATRETDESAAQEELQNYVFVNEGYCAFLDSENQILESNNDCSCFDINTCVGLKNPMCISVCSVLTGCTPEYEISEACTEDGYHIVDVKKECPGQEPPRMPCVSSGLNPYVDDKDSDSQGTAGSGPKCEEILKRSVENANDCIVKNSRTMCLDKPAPSLELCLGIMGDDTCENDPIYNRYSGQCEQTDTDADGIDDRFEEPSCIGTSQGSIVDDNGCACAQKKCADTNPCTDDFCNAKTAQCMNADDDTNKCGSYRVCPKDRCEEVYPFTSRFDYPENGYDKCDAGQCIQYSCDVLDKIYSDECKPDDDDGSKPNSMSSPEICDGVDNDLDGKIDDSLLDEPCDLYLGVCAGSTASCINGDFAACSASDYGAGYTKTENMLCDGLDNDCDGSTDEGCTCTGKETKDCGSDEGICHFGKQTCSNGRWDACVGEVEPKNEMCNSLDDDCDGIIDESKEANSAYTIKESCTLNSCRGTKTCTPEGFSDCILIDDIDKDSVCDEIDNCISRKNPSQEDADKDGLGDECDICPRDSQNDLDKDGFCGDIDNCQYLFNKDQKNQDMDEKGDACDSCPKDDMDDIDGDKICADA